MKSVRLPLQTPPIISLMHHGYPLSIVLNYKNALPWLYSNYIQLYVKHDEPLTFTSFDFFHYNYPNKGAYITPYLFSKMFDRKDIIQFASMDAFLHNCMDQNFYVHMQADEFYLPNKYGYKKIHMVHDVLIFGYDTSTREYDISGFDQNGTFRPTKASSSQLEQSFQDSKYFNRNWHDHITIYTLLDDSEDYPFHLPIIIELLKDYVQGRDTSLRYGIRNYPFKQAFGKDIYPFIREYLTNINSGRTDVDIRPFHLLWEHKKLMLDRIEFLTEQGYLSYDSMMYEQYARVEQLAFRLRGDILKASIARSKDYIKNGLELINALVEMEIPLLSNMIELLEAYDLNQTVNDERLPGGDTIEFQF